MQRGWIVLALLACTAGAQAQSVMFGKRLIGKGDTVSEVRDAAGSPDRLDRIDGDDSTPTMEIWTWRDDAREVTLWIVDGKVVKAQEKALPRTGG